MISSQPRKQVHANYEKKAEKVPTIIIKHFASRICFKVCKKNAYRTLRV